MTKDEFHEFITKLYYWATSYFPEEMRNQTYELLLTLLDTYYPSDGSSKPSAESDCNMPRVTGSAFDAVDLWNEATKLSTLECNGYWKALRDLEKLSVIKIGGIEAD